ncbi:MAG: hypothetical protein LBD55_09100 [Treponema sp.]|jgi:hypothetical protein|nr:hypothetical protein [Treponema sp.]
MNIFLIEIGRYSRRGNFDKLFQKVVSVPDDCYMPAVKSYFEGKYDGFNVRISHVEEVAELSIPNGDTPQKTEFYLHFDVKYTDREKELFSEYRDFMDKANAALRWLHGSIEDRFKSLFYSGICNLRPLELETSRYGTHCHKFPIDGARFESVAKNAEEDYTPERNPASPETPPEATSDAPPRQAHL